MKHTFKIVKFKETKSTVVYIPEQTDEPELLTSIYLLKKDLPQPFPASLTLSIYTDDEVENFGTRRQAD